jgi:hypothetical protein
MSTKKQRFNELVKTDLPRFWDTYKNEMIYPDIFVDTICYKYQYRYDDEIARYHISILSKMLLNPRFIRMKPTGLEDKHGKLIYEGDIVIEVNGIDPLDTSYSCVKEVIFIKDVMIGFNINYCHEYEIIGNIYDNKELLEE